MCLNLHESKLNEDKDFKNLLHRSKNGVVICYKSLSLSNGKLYSRHYPGKPWKYNEFKKGNRSRFLSVGETTTINQGIHVYINRPKTGYPYIVKVACDLRDFVAVGQRGEAVFTRVKLIK